MHKNFFHNQTQWCVFSYFNTYLMCFTFITVLSMQKSAQMEDLSPGMTGVLITTNDQEKLCVSEAYNLFNEACCSCRYAVLIPISLWLCNCIRYSMLTNSTGLNPQSLIIVHQILVLVLRQNLPYLKKYKTCMVVSKNQDDFWPPVVVPSMQSLFSAVLQSFQKTLCTTSCQM